MKIWINAVASTAGGGKTYLGRLIEDLRNRPGDFGVWVPSQFEPGDPLPDHVRLRKSDLAGRGYLGRLMWEQVVLPRAVERSGADALVCLGNVCPLRFRVPTVLLSANAHYFCERYGQDLQARGELRRLAEYRLKRAFVVRSAQVAQAVVTPTQSMADELTRAASRVDPIVSFFGGLEGFGGLDGSNRSKPSAATPGSLLVVSHYNYFRNFETVFRAVALLRAKGRDVRLVLTTRLERGLKQGGYDSTAAVDLIDKLGIVDAVETLGEVSREGLQQVLGRAQIVICPGYVESFSFTLVEAMSAGVPVLASDISTHREVGAEAAEYFSTFDPDDLADKCERLMESEPDRARMSSAGLDRAKAFDWKAHFDCLFETIGRVATRRHV